MTSLTNLPLEVLLLIAEHVHAAKDFLSLCASCHEFQDADDLRYAPSYWSRLTKQTFRVPNQPVVETDGWRWCSLYRRMLKETRLYVWGKNDGGSLGKPPMQRIHSIRGRGRLRGGPIRVQPLNEDVQANAAWPQELELPEDAGIIADLQCGGWSTAALTASGRIFLTGTLHETFGFGSHGLREVLALQDVDKAVFEQFSLGRSHLLALADNGQIYSWDGSGENGTPLNLPLEHDQSRLDRVVAGWAHSSAFIPGEGIHVWKPVNPRLQHAQSVPQPAMDVAPAWIWNVPLTAELTPSLISASKRAQNGSHPQKEALVKWVVLEHFVVWVTSFGRVLIALIPDDLSTSTGDPIDITPYTRTGEDKSREAVDVLDVQGSFRSFAILKRTGEVLTSNQDTLNDIWQVGRPGNTEGQQGTGFQKIPALQHTGVIQIAFGDWHFHALHADGSISSYGKELQFCGALGLGGMGIDAMRGIKGTGFGGDGVLLSHCSTTGRRVCFEKEKQDFMDHLRTGGKNKREAVQRMDMTYENDEARATVSEWFEQRLRKWEDVLPQDEQRNNPNDDGLPAYFALSVAAAGWHSGALVLRNDKKAEKVADCYRDHRQSDITGQSAPIGAESLEDASFLQLLRSATIGLGRQFLGLPAAGGHPSQASDEPSWLWEDERFPRLRLSDGEVMPGEAPVEEWTCPQWKQVETVVQDAQNE